MTPGEFQAELRRRAENVKTDLGKAINNACVLVENTAKKGMTSTERDTSKTYEHGHHPSVEFDYPAVDTGRLRQSVTHNIQNENGEIVGRVGSNVKYAAYLEYGTSRMSPRPWLKPSVAINREKIFTLISQAVKKGQSKTSETSE